MAVPAHIFLSYSASNGADAEAIADDLRKAGIPVWIDTAQLTPGTPDWERAVREALAQSFAVVLLASPESKDSVYVRGELTLATANGCSVIPLWISGSQWVDSVPLRMMCSQYIDWRGESRARGMDMLVRALSVIIERMTPEHYQGASGAPTRGFISIELPCHETEEGAQHACFCIL